MIPLFEHAHTLTLTDTEKEILEYFETHIPGAMGISLHELSAALYTSNATIVRFCQKLGLHGYNDFKYQLRQEISRQHADIPESSSLIPRSVAQFRDNLDLLDMDKLHTAADMLTGNRSIYIYGQNLSSLPARYLQSALTNMDYPSILIDWPELLAQLSREIDDSSVLFIISAHCEKERFLPVFKNASERGAITILLTCERQNPVDPYCSIYLSANDRNQEFHQVDLNTRFGMFTIIQLLIELVSHR